MGAIWAPMKSETNRSGGKSTEISNFFPNSISTVIILFGMSIGAWASGET
jgi:hypothetical protein